MSGHSLLPARVYVGNFCVLAFLMALTVWAYYATFVPAALALPIALAIAITKATFIILVFMNVYWSSKLTKIFAAAGFCWLMILLFFLAIEYGWPELGHIYTDVEHIGVNPLELPSSAVADAAGVVVEEAGEHH